MKVVILSPTKVIVAGVVAALLIAAAGFGTAAIMGVFRVEPAQAYKWPSDGGTGVGAKSWYFAEGYTGAGFEEWILVYNPPADMGGSGNMVSADLQFFGPNGYIGNFNTGPMAPGQRVSVNINEVLSTKFNYSGDVSIVAYNPNWPFICERAMYWNYKGKWQGGGNVLGYEEAETGR
jgi:hypothetical protein